MSANGYVLRRLTTSSFAVFAGDEAVGFGAFAPPDSARGVARLLGAAVLSGHRGHGLYRRLVELRTREVLGRGATRVVARVPHDAPAALAVLLDCGFAMVDIDPGDGMRGLVHKPLPTAARASPRHRSALLVAVDDTPRQTDALARGLVGRELIRHGTAGYVLFGEPEGPGEGAAIVSSLRSPVQRNSPLSGCPGTP